MTEKRIGRFYVLVDVGWLEGFGFSRCSNGLLIHPLPFLTIFIEWVPR